MLEVLGRTRSVPESGRGRVFVIASLLLWGSLAGFSYAHVTNPDHGNQWTDHGGWGIGSAKDQVVSLDSGESVNLSSLVGARGQSLQVGDKLFADFSFGFKGTDCGGYQNNLKPSAISVTALATDAGYGISFTGPLTATGKTAEDLTIGFSITVTDPNYLISAVHLSNSSSVCGKAFSSVVEKVFTGKSCGNSTKVAQLEVLNPGHPDPAFQDLVVLTQPRDRLYVQQEMMFGGGRGFGIRNHASFFGVDDVFSQTAQIPEPSTMALLVAGLLILLIVQRRASS